jgi:TRAP-type C4-dicarboxylate transport system permease small subunit
MLQTLRKRFATIVAGLALAVIPAVVPVAVVSASEIQDNLQCGTTLTVEGTGGCQSDIDAGSSTITDTIKKVINFFSAIVGIVSVIMIIYGGFKYISSGGDSGNVTSAKNTIIYAVIGLVVVAMAQFIVQFVLGKVIGGQ